MSANLYWEPVRRKKHDLNVGAPQSFMEKLDKAFGSRTPVLRDSDVSTLKGMRAASEPYLDSIFSELIDAVDRHDEIQISAEY